MRSRVRSTGRLRVVSLLSAVVSFGALMSFTAGVFSANPAQGSPPSVRYAPLDFWIIIQDAEDAGGGPFDLREVALAEPGNGTLLVRFTVSNRTHQVPSPLSPYTSTSSPPTPPTPLPSTTPVSSTPPVSNTAIPAPPRAYEGILTLWFTPNGNESMPDVSLNVTTTGRPYGSFDTCESEGNQTYCLVAYPRLGLQVGTSLNRTRAEARGPAVRGDSSAEGPILDAAPGNDSGENPLPSHDAFGENYVLRGSTVRPPPPPEAIRLQVSRPFVGFRKPLLNATLPFVVHSLDSRNTTYEVSVVGVPQGWTHSIGQATGALGALASRPGALTVAVPSGTPAGTYVLQLLARAPLGGQSSIGIKVRVGLPLEVAGVSVSETTSQSALVAWTVSAAGDEDSWVTYWVGQTNSTTEPLPGNGTKQLRLTGLRPATTYSYRVVARAADPAQELESATSTFRTLEAPGPTNAPAPGAGPRAPPPPVAAFDATSRGLLVRFDASRTVDPSGLNLTIGWDLGDGNVSSEPFLAHRYQRPGSYTVTLNVTNGDGATSNASKALTLVAMGPKAAIRSDLTRVEEGGAFTLDALESVEGDSLIVEYGWDLGDGRFEPGGMTLATDTHHLALVRGADADSWDARVRLQVTDGIGRSDVAALKIVVTPAGPGAETASPAEHRDKGGGTTPAWPVHGLLLILTLASLSLRRRIRA